MGFNSGFKGLMKDALKRTWHKLIVALLKALSDIYLEEGKRT